MRQGVFTPKLKLLWHRDKINEWITTGDTTPVMVEIDLTNRCNLKCNFCTFDYMKDKSDIPTTTIIKAIEDMADMGVKSINFTGGGEPSLHHQFLYIVKYAYSVGISVGVFTNGMNLSESICKEITNYCDWIRVSLDCASPEMFKKIKGVDGFKRVLVATENLVKDKKDCTIGIGFVITRDNYKEIPLFSKLSKELGVDYAQFKPEIRNCFEDKDKESWWWLKEVKPLLDEVMNDNNKAVINLYKFNDLLSGVEREYGTCYGHYFVPCLGATGDLWVCTHLREIDGFSFGNIKEDSFKNIWNSKKRKEVISKIDLSKCQLYCRNNEINKVLWALKTNDKKGHYNFI